MAKVKMTDAEKQQLVKDLKECESISEDIQNAKKANIPGVDMLEQRHKECVESLRAKYEVYGRRGA